MAGRVPYDRTIGKVSKILSQIGPWLHAVGEGMCKNEKKERYKEATLGHWIRLKMSVESLFKLHIQCSKLSK
jgi:hypothetical protein